MPDPQTPDRTDTSPADPSSALKELPSWQQELGSTLWKWLTGGATLGSLVTLLSTTELPKVALGAAVGVCMIASLLAFYPSLFSRRDLNHSRQQS